MMSLRARVSLIVVLVSVVGLTVASSAVYGVVRRDQDSRLDSFLREGVRQIAYGVDSAAGSLAPTDQLDDGTSRVYGLDAIYGDLRDGDGVRLRDQTGKTFPALSQSLVGRRAPSLVLPDRLGQATETGRTFSARDTTGARYRVLYALPRPLPRGIHSQSGLASPTSALAGTPTVIAVTTSNRDTTLRQLLRVEVLTTSIAALILGALSWLLVGLGLRPLRRIEDSAATIAGGDLTHRIELASERTEVGRLGRSLNAMLGQIEASQEQLRRFLADASHELRTPLTSIRAYAELYRRGPARSGEMLETAMSRIESESTRMSSLVSDLLELARLRQNRVLDRAPLDVGVLCSEAAIDVRVAEPLRRITVRVRGPVAIEADESRLTQVIMNLLANAQKHTTPNSPIEIEAIGEAGGVRIRVIDHGSGVSEESREHIFDPFYRSDPSRARGTGGTGLGLAIVNEIVAAHEGSAAVETTSGGGATFVVWIPRPANT
jgi:two-component system, OmpR family, sensor kinase